MSKSGNKKTKPSQSSRVDRTGDSKPTDSKVTRSHYDRPQPNRWRLVIVFFVVSLGGSFVWYFLIKDANIQTFEYDVVNTYEHDASAYTQGLIFLDDALYESTGQQNASNVRKVEIKTGNVLKQTPIDDELFGEGLTFLNDKLYQITWKDKKGFVYDKNLKLIREFDYDNEGWGLTTDGKSLIMSNGTPTLRYYNPETFEEEKRITVRMGGSRLWKLNELEYIDGKIFANVYEKDYIVEIDPTNGFVVGRIDLSELEPGSESAEVLNGIAYNTANRTIFVTGKYWGKIYEIKLKR